MWPVGDGQEEAGKKPGGVRKLPILIFDFEFLVLVYKLLVTGVIVAVANLALLLASPEGHI